MSKDMRKLSYVRKFGQYWDGLPQEDLQMCHECCHIRVKENLFKRRCDDECRCAKQTGYGQYNWRCRSGWGCKKNDY